MMRQLLTGVFVTAVAALPLVARADWDNLKEHGASLEQQGKDLQQKGKDVEKRGTDLKKKGDTAHDNAVTDYNKGRAGVHEGEAMGSRADRAIEHDRSAAARRVDDGRTTVRHDLDATDHQIDKVRRRGDYAKRTTTTTATHRR